MTHSADTMSSGSAKALTPAGETAGLEPFIAGAADTPRTLASRLLDYSAHAAMIVGLVGFAWTVSNHVKRPTAAQLLQAPAVAAKPMAKPDEAAELRRSNQKMAEDIHHLQASLDALRASVREDKSSAQIRVLQAGLETVRTGLNAARGETVAALAQVNGKLDRLDHDPKVQGIAERVGKLEKSGVDLSTTSSLPPVATTAPLIRPAPLAAKPSAAAKLAIATVPTPPAKPASLVEEARKVPDDGRVAQDGGRKDEARRADDQTKEAAKEAAKPPVLAGWVVRDVYKGVALLESRRGQLEVVPGVSIPGGGVVKSIDRHGSGWTVTTTKGLVAYAAPPRRAARNDGEGYYGDYGGYSGGGYGFDF